MKTSSFETESILLLCIFQNSGAMACPRLSLLSTIYLWLCQSPSSSGQSSFQYRPPLVNTSFSLVFHYLWSEKCFLPRYDDSVHLLNKIAHGLASVETVFIFTLLTDSLFLPTAYFVFPSLIVSSCSLCFVALCQVLPCRKRVAHCFESGSSPRIPLSTHIISTLTTRTPNHIEYTYN